MSCRFHCWCWSWGLERFENTPLVSRKSKSTTPLCCPVGLTLYIVPQEMHHIMVTSKSKSAGLTLYIVHIIASHDGYELDQIGYTLWSIDFTVRHVNQICSSICRFHCLMCISMTSTVFKLFLHLLFYIFLILPTILRISFRAPHIMCMCSIIYAFLCILANLWVLDELYINCRHLFNMSGCKIIL